MNDVAQPFRAAHPGRPKGLRYTPGRPEGLRYMLLCATIVVLSISSRAQVRYAVGQNVAPVFEGWERNADGSFNFVFGYMNRNYEEEVDVPVGPSNILEPGSADQGQPAHLYTPR